MKVKVRFLSLIREHVGKDEDVIEVDSESITVVELLAKLRARYPGLDKALKLLDERGLKPVIMVNGMYAKEDTIVTDGAEVAVLPPAAGGGARAGTVTNPISLDKLAEELARHAAREGAGALVVFMGFVKGVVDGERVERLIYEAYEPYATKILNEIAEKYSRIDGVLDVVVYHRIGELKPGEPTIYVAVTAMNRHVAFRVAAEVLEEVKHKAPIYKLEKRSDGDYWVVGDGTRIPKATK